MKLTGLMILVVCVLTMVASNGVGDDTLLNLGPEELVQADGIDIKVSGYSVPSFVDWNNDKLDDLVIGEGGGSGNAKVRIYLNVGSESNPQFLDYFYAQSDGSDLTSPAYGCMGCFPRVVYWDTDTRKDLLIGQANGNIKLFLNVGTDVNPTFDGGKFLQVGQPGLKKNIDVGDRATPSLTDWDNDSIRDLIVGAYDARIHIFINEGTNTEPNFITETFAQAYGSNLIVPGKRACPVILDLDGDNKKDILTGNTDGQLLFYRNVGTNSEPRFSDYSHVESNGVPIDLPGWPRSRIFVCYWTGDGHFGPIDGYLDVLIGAGDGKVHLYRGTPVTGDIDTDGDVDFTDFALFAAYWLQSDCGRCGGADLTNDEIVEIGDLCQFTPNWLTSAE